MGFLFVFQVMLVAPLSIASGAVGFADYLGFYWTGMKPWTHQSIAAAVAAGMTALLYRPIESVGRLSVVMLYVLGITVSWVVAAGLWRFSAAQAFAFPPSAFTLNGDLLARIGAVSLLAMYNYGGYNTVCNIAEEVRDPVRNIPRAIVLSIVVVVTLYIVMSSAIIGVMPWTEAASTRTIASVFIERTVSSRDIGRLTAHIMTACVLFVTASSLYALILGYSRIPFAAARGGQFFKVFAHLHPTKHFPDVSLITIGALSIPFCFFTLGQIVNWLILVQIVSQFVWQCAGVVLLHRYRKDVAQPFVMWMYPIPAMVALALWIWVFVTAPASGQLFAASVAALGIVAFVVFERLRAGSPD